MDFIRRPRRFYQGLTRGSFSPFMKIPFPCFRTLGAPLVLVVALSCAALAQEPAFLSRFSQFDYGKDQKLPLELSAYVRDHKSDAPALKALGETLKKSATTDDALNLACVTLGDIGSDADVPYLASQLGKPAIFASARTALQRLGSPVAYKALIDYAAALENDDELATILLSLGQARAADGVPLLSQKSADPNLLVRRAAFSALADIANPAAAAALTKVEPKAEDGSASAQMTLAATFAAQGKKAEAAAISTKILNTASLAANIHDAAIRLVLSAELPGAPALLTKLATNPQPATEPFVLANFSRLSPDQQKAIVAGIVSTQTSKEAVLKLQLIGPAFPVPALRELVTSPNAGMQRAATLLLARIATKADFDQLLADYLALPAGDGKATPLRNALGAMPSIASDWLSAALTQSKDPGQQVVIIGLAKERMARSAAQALINAATSPDPAVRKAAREALAVIGAPAQAGTLLDMLLAAKEPAERRDLAKALSLSLRQSPDKAAVIAKATSQLATVSDPAVKDAIIDLMGKSGEPACLPVLFAEFNKSDKARRTVILRAISNWQDEGPLDELAIIAASDPDSASRIFALRAFLEVLAKSQTLAPESKLQRLWQANLLATRPEEHRMIISQAATLSLPATRMLLGAYRFDPEVKAELAAATKAHEDLLAGPKKPAPDAEDTAPKTDGDEKTTTASTKPKYPDNPFDTPGAFEKWEDPLGLAGRWTAGQTTLDLVQYPNRTFQALLTSAPGAAPQKVFGLLDKNNVLHLYGPGVTGAISKQAADLVIDGKATPLKRTTVGKAEAFPRPQGARIIFDGKKLDGFRATKAKILPDGAVEMPAKLGSLVTKDGFGSARVYAEFRLPFNPESTGPRRGNSGVYLMSTYEVQIQDGFGTELSTVGAEPADRSCGSIYGISAPKLNASAPPLEWQSYLIEFHAPQFDAAGQKTRNANMSVWLNGQLVQDKVDVPRPTGGDAGAAEKAKPEPKEPSPIILQNHGNSLQFRNVWIEPLPATQS